MDVLVNNSVFPECAPVKCLRRKICNIILKGGDTNLEAVAHANKVLEVRSLTASYYSVDYLFHVLLNERLL